MKQQAKTGRFPRRDCMECGGQGFVSAYPNLKFSPVVKCKCWREVEFGKSSRSGEVVQDGKSAACGASE